MKYIIASDIHGSAHFARLFAQRVEEENPDKVILLGDLLYHGARNALPGEYDTLKTAAILNGMKEKLLCVRGNCDSEVDALVLEFPINADYCILPIGERTAIFTHGHKTPAVLQNGDVLFNGHYHVPAFEKLENYTYVNCGSVSIPKQNPPYSYLVLEDRNLLWKDVQTGEIFRREKL